MMNSWSRHLYRMPAQCVCCVAPVCCASAPVSNFYHMSLVRYAVICLLTAFTTITPYGYNQVCINLPQHFLQKFEQISLEDHYGSHLSSATLVELYSAVNSLFAVGALIGGLLVAPTAELFGRRPALFVLSGLIQTAASLFQGLSIELDSFELFLGCRLLTGLASVLSAGLATIYIIEISPKQYRGLAGSLTHTGHAFGCFIGMSLGMDTYLGSETLFLSAMVPLACISVILGLSGLLPESPRFAFMTRNDPIRARKALKKLGFDDIRLEEMMNDMEVEQADDAKHHHNNQRSMGVLCTDKVALHALIASVLINVSQSFMIFYPLIAYSTVMLRKLGGATEMTAEWFTMSIGIADISSAIVCPWVVNALPRRVAFIGNMLGMSFCTVIMWVSLHLSDGPLGESHGELLLYTFIGASLALVVMFSLGPGPISMFIPAEISPQNTRSLTVSVSKTIRWVVIAGCSQVYYGLLISWGANSIAPYFVMSLLLTLVVIYFMPESQRKTLTQMWAHLEDSKDLDENDLIKPHHKEK